jgi:mannose-6-phosphate isomerase-like protein (cupin superfamily)
MGEVRHERWHAGDGALTERRMMKLMEFEGYDVSVYTYRPGTAFAEHVHEKDKCDGVLEGILRVTVKETLFELRPGDRLYLPAGTPHSAEVLGPRTVVSLDGTRW